ncbi:MAG: hypothetical protein G3M70_04840 [Candidatus Nitronauta litoralis]|uniref:Uncharacterized protein n=1 Tax=Candidatus Nitronauta litoralis TaxID=2705533 RepID=A0A7T0FZE4_9BACT|nr:MAG: hypothetical protein G3M70_04840 [Candidatus Nitronauta litoralis]
MKIIDKHRFLKLLSEVENFPYSDSLNQMRDYLVSAPVPGKEIQEIYSRRFETAGNDFDGFNELLQILPTLSNLKVKIHSFDLNSKRFIFFTDPQTKIIYGSLVERNPSQK